MAVVLDRLSNGSIIHSGSITEWKVSKEKVSTVFKTLGNPVQVDRV